MPTRGIWWRERQIWQRYGMRRNRCNADEERLRVRSRHRIFKECKCFIVDEIGTVVIGEVGWWRRIALEGRVVIEIRPRVNENCKNQLVYAGLGKHVLQSDPFQPLAKGLSYVVVECAFISFPV